MENLRNNWNKVSLGEVLNFDKEIDYILQAELVELEAFLAGCLRQRYPHHVHVYTLSPTQYKTQVRIPREMITLQATRILEALQLTWKGQEKIKNSEPIDQVLDQLKPYVERLTDSEFLGVRYSFNKLRLFCRIRSRLSTFLKQHFNKPNCQQGNSTTLMVQELWEVVKRDTYKTLGLVNKSNTHNQFEDKEYKLLLMAYNQRDFIAQKIIAGSSKDKAYKKIAAHVQEIFPSSMAKAAATPNQVTTSELIAQEQEVQADGPSENVPEEDFDTWFNKNWHPRQAGIPVQRGLTS